MGDSTIDSKVIKDMRKEIERLKKINEEKDARIETLQKSAVLYLNYYNQTRNKDLSIDTIEEEEVSSPNPKMANHLLHTTLPNVQHLILRSTSSTLKEG